MGTIPRGLVPRGWMVCAAIVMVLVTLVQPSSRPARAATAATMPQTIPALQQWTAASGTYTFTSTSRVVDDTAFASQLSTTATVFAGDLSLLTGVAVTHVADTPADVRAGDIFLTLGSTDAGLGQEGYTLAVGSSITIQARTDAGAFYGTRTVLQLLHQHRTLPDGSARDWPVYPQRGLMVDVGRKYFSVAWLQQQIRDLAYAKLNYLHLHLSDNLGFRLESSSHPEIVSRQHYTKQQMADLIALAARYHVTIVPEIDMPGHMNAILASHPQLKLTSSTGVVNPGFIDLSDPASYALMKDLIEEYLPLFPGPYWHLGADEYVTNYSSYPQLLSYARAHYGAGATPKDTYYGFINWADGLVRAAGKTMRTWNDGIAAGDGTIAPNADITVDDWYNRGLTPQQLVDAGHLVMNSSYRPTYYVLHKGDTGPFPDLTVLYETWTPNVFQGGATLSDPTRNLGAKLHVWCDYPAAETEAQVASGTLPALRAMAQQTWGSPRLVATYAAFSPIIAAIGRTPGFAPAAACVQTTQAGSWQNTPFANQTGSFGVQFDATPSQAGMNGVMGLSNGAATAYTSLAAIARFNSSGDIDARNGGAYAAASTVPYQAGVSYHFRLAVDVTTHTYSIFVTAPGGTEQTVGSGFAFRSEQSGVGQLNSWGAFSDAGSENVCGFALT